MDMNGVLLVRSKSGSKRKERKAYLRPHLDELLNTLHELSGRVKVAVWSSMMEFNLYPLVEDAFGDFSASLEFVWDQEWCTRTFVKGIKKPVFRKDLQNLKWSDWYEHFPDNVLLIDDDPIKCTTNPVGTAIHPKTYTGAEEDDSELLSIASYLRALVASECTAKDFVLSHPYETCEDMPLSEEPIMPKRKLCKLSGDADPVDLIEAYWPDEDTWLPATLVRTLANGDMMITWDEDGSTSTVPSDYIRHVL